MSLAALFEHFDTTPATDTGPAQPSADWQAGHEAGLADGVAQAEAAQTALQRQTAEAIADLALTLAEARADTLARLAPLFAALADRIVPRLLRDTLGAALLDELARAAEAALGGPLVLRIAEADHDAVAALLPLIPGTEVTLETDLHLGPGQALIDGGATGTALDIDRLAVATTEALAALPDLLQGQRRHG